MTETKRFPLQPGCGPVYSKIYQLLTETMAARLADEEVSAAAGVNCSVGSKGYGTACRVIKAVEKTGRVWRRDRGTASIRLLEANEKVTHSVAIVGKASRIVKRGATVIRGVDMTKLNNEEKVHANAVAAQLGALALLSQSSTAKKIEVRHGEAVADTSAVFALMNGKTDQQAAR